MTKTGEEKKMKKKQINKAPESRMIGKVIEMVDHLYPKIEEEAKDIFIYENKDLMKTIKRKIDFRLTFHAWFLLKFELPNGATAMEMADSFPLKFFNKNEKKMIKNFLNYKESLFEISEISENKKDYTVKNLLDNKIYLVKTVDLPEKLKKNDLILARIIKNLKNDYFFYGGIQTFNIKDKNKFIKEMLRNIKLENTIHKKRKDNVIEWEFDKEQNYKEEVKKMQRRKKLEKKRR